MLFLLYVFIMVIFFPVEENRAEVARFAKNFLPIFFNIYTSGNSREDTTLAAVLETAKVYFKIADPEVGFLYFTGKIF